MHDNLKVMLFNSRYVNSQQKSFFTFATDEIQNYLGLCYLLSKVNKLKNSTTFIFLYYY